MTSKHGEAGRGLSPQVDSVDGRGAGGGVRDGVRHQDVQATRAQGHGNGRHPVRTKGGGGTRRCHF